MISLLSLLFFSWIIVWVNGINPQIGFVYDGCRSNNKLEFSQSSGGSLYWSEAQFDFRKGDHGLMNNTHIINCSIILKGLPQNAEIRKRFFGIHFRQWNFDSNYKVRYNETLAKTLFSPFTQQIFNICGIDCGTGCMQIQHPKTKNLKTFCGANKLEGTDYIEYFEESTLTLKFSLLGGFYIPVVNGTEAILNRSSTGFIIDFYSFYFGKCQDESKEFQCVTTHRCIDIILKCDNYSGRHCGMPLTGGILPYDLTVCETPVAAQNLLPLLALLALPLVILLLIWLFYRPGLCCWRCARLRNCPGCARCCTRVCAFPCVMGGGPTMCGCCKSSSATGPCGSCCGDGRDGENDGGDKDELNPNKSNRNKDYSVQGDDDMAAWQDYATGDGYHLRECR